MHVVVTCKSKKYLVLGHCRWKKKNAKLINSGAIFPNQPNKKSTDNKPAEHIYKWQKLHFEVLHLQLRSKINFLVGPQEPLLATSKRRKLAWFEHVTRHDSLFKTILQGTLEGGQRHDRRGNAGWTTSKSGHPCPCQNCSQGLLQERLEEDLCWIDPHVPHHPFDHLVCELNCILKFWIFSRLNMLPKR